MKKAEWIVVQADPPHEVVRLRLKLGDNYTHLGAVYGLGAGDESSVPTRGPDKGKQYRAHDLNDERAYFKRLEDAKLWVEETAKSHATRMLDGLEP